MKIYHTSPEKIQQINSFGLFGDALCFAEQPYVMTAAPSPVMYSIEIDEEEIIDACSFFFREDYEKLGGLVTEIMEMVECDEDTAQDLLSGKAALVDVAGEFDAEQDFEIQKMAVQAAKILGYRAVLLRDEQGPMYLVSMLGRESDLKEEQE